MPSWIYAITEKDLLEYIYIGSTTGKYFCLRKGEHTRPSTTKSGKQKHLYGYIKEKGGWERFQFDILFNSEVDIEKTNLRKIERQYIETHNPKCNKFNPIETYEEKLERKRKQLKKWRKDNPDYLIKNKERQSQIEYTKRRCSTKIDCACGGKYTLQNKTNHFSRNIHKKYEEERIKIENNSKITSS
jgi:hypothetical protein